MNAIKMILQYEIKSDLLHQYREAMKTVIRMLPDFDVDQIQLHHSSSNPNWVIETFTVPTEAHYFALKKLRQSKYHEIFGCLDTIVLGGNQKIQCFGLRKNP